MKNSISRKDQSKFTDSMLRFLISAIQTKSLSNQEEQMAHLLYDTMKTLEYDSVVIDSTGNVLGRIGSGPVKVLFDSHMDTVDVLYESEWKYPPFSAAVADGRIWGRGSVDMKSSLAASVYAAAAAKELHLTDGLTIYVSGTVDEEFSDGESLKMMLSEAGITPDYAVICEPSDNDIAIGHNGKALVSITTKGISSHGSEPQSGRNAVYEMNKVLSRIEEISNISGTIAVTDIHSDSVSINAVPQFCSICIDRRLSLAESKETLTQEMDRIVSETSASWQINPLIRKSWRGSEIRYMPIHEPWSISEEHPLTRACAGAYEKAFGKKPDSFRFWNFSTNAVATVGLGIPTIGFGPGNPLMCHKTDENCQIEKIQDAFCFYLNLIKEFSSRQ